MRKLLFLLILFFSLHAMESDTPSSTFSRPNIFTYHKIMKHIEVMARDPLLFLDNLEKSIDITKMSWKERKGLADQLEKLKNSFCSRPMKSALWLPIIITIGLGVKSWLDYENLNYSSSFKNSLVFRSVYEKNINNFTESFFVFLIAMAVTIVVEVNHGISVSSLFIKERRIERKIDKIIVLLRNYIDKKALYKEIEADAHMICVQEMARMDRDWDELSQGNVKLEKDLMKLYGDFHAGYLHKAQKSLNEFCKKWELERIQI